MGINFKSSYHIPLLLTGVIVIILCTDTVTAVVCGGFNIISSPGHFVSPNHPNMYPNFTRCIWVFEAPTSNRVHLQINFTGQETTAGGRTVCNDYIEVRDGSESSNLLLTSCSALTSYNLTSTSRWLWFLFQTDGYIATSGLRVTYSKEFVGPEVNNYTSPLVSCRTHEFTCSNRHCISNSYRCDGYPDCGCGNEGCDEEGCGGLTMTYGARLAMGIGIGFAIFILVCMFSLLWERRHNWARLKNKDAEKNKNKNKR